MKTYKVTLSNANGYVFTFIAHADNKTKAKEYARSRFPGAQVIRAGGVF